MWPYTFHRYSPHYKYISNHSQSLQMRNKEKKLYSLPNDKILDWYELNAFAEDKIKVLKNDDLCL